MKSMLLVKPKVLEITESPTPEISAHEVLVRVKACGICGSDVHGFDGSSGRRIPPLIMGHEAAGVVEAVGAEVTNVAVGDRVTFDSTVYCGRCHFCRQGKVNLCDDRMVLGVSCGDYRRHGAFAEWLNVPSHVVYKIPETLSFEHAAMIEAVSVAVHATEIAKLKSTDSVLIVGTGMIGLLLVQAVAQSGCQRIIAVDQDDQRLALAAKFGATTCLNATEVDVQELIQAETNGEGVDVSFEVVGATVTIGTAIGSVKKGGTVVLVGNLAPQVEIPLQSVVTREIKLLGSCASAGEYPKCIELMATGAIDVSPLISAVAPLDEGPGWFDRLYDHEPGLMKVILQP